MGIFGGSTTQTSRYRNETNLDAASQNYVNGMRGTASQAANLSLMSNPFEWARVQQQYMNPYMQQVMQPLRAEFNMLRDRAVTGANQQATQGGAFGGSRHALTAGVRLGELDRAEMGQIGNMMYQGYNDSLNRLNQDRVLQGQILQQSLGPTGQVSQGYQRNTTESNPGVLGTIGGIAQIGAGLFSGGGLFGGGGAPAGGPGADPANFGAFSSPGGAFNASNPNLFGAPLQWGR